MSVNSSVFSLFWIILAAFIVFLVLIVLFLVLKHKRLRKPAAIATVVLVAITGSIYLFNSAQASLDYWFMSDETYTAAGDNYVTIQCENTGHLAGTATLKLQFTNAEFSTKTSQPYQQINNRTAQFTFIVQPGEKQNARAYFIINSNISDFYIDLSAENGGNFLVKYNSNGVNYVSYHKFSDEGSYLQQTAAPPP